MTAGDQPPSTPPQPPPLLTVGAGEGAGRYVLEFAPGGVVACQRDEIHSSPTPTHHPANPVNSKNFKYPTREKKRNPAIALADPAQHAKLAAVLVLVS